MSVTVVTRRVRFGLTSRTYANHRVAAPHKIPVVSHGYTRVHQWPPTLGFSAEYDLIIFCEQK